MILSGALLSLKDGRRQQLWQKTVDAQSCFVKADQIVNERLAKLVV